MGELNYETRHKLKSHDFAILDKFEFKYAPVGFKLFNVEAYFEGLALEHLDSRIAQATPTRRKTPTRRASSGSASRESSDESM